MTKDPLKVAALRSKIVNLKEEVNYLKSADMFGIIDTI